MSTTTPIEVDPAAHHDPRAWVRVAAMMAEDSFTIAQIAAELDMSRPAVYDALTPVGRRRRRPPGNPACGHCGQTLTYPSLTLRPLCRRCRKVRARAQDEQIIALWRAGWRADRIAAELALASQYVSGRVNNIRRFQGVELPYRRPPSQQ